MFFNLFNLVKKIIHKSDLIYMLSTLTNKTREVVLEKNLEIICLVSKCQKQSETVLGFVFVTKKRKMILNIQEIKVCTKNITIR